jgi:asparagine synthetase A
VDQWDWEKVIETPDRNLKDTVTKIYKSVHDTEKEVCTTYGITPILPE